MSGIIGQRFVVGPQLDAHGQLLLGRDRWTDERVWINRIHRESASAQSLILDALQHRSINAPLLVGEHAGDPVSVSAALVGASLRDAIKLGARWSPLRLARCLFGLVSGLAEIHARGGVVRGPWPEDVWHVPAPSDRWVIVRFERLLRRRGGSPPFGIFNERWSAPEQADYSPATDVFSVGALACALSTGRPPFAQGLERLRREVAPMGLAEVQPVALRDLLSEMLAFEPARRPPVSAVLERLQRLIEPAARDRLEPDTAPATAFSPPSSPSPPATVSTSTRTHYPEAAQPPQVSPVGKCFPLLADANGVLAPKGFSPPRAPNTGGAGHMPPAGGLPVGGAFTPRTPRWAIVVHASEGRQILDALAPLIGLRSRQTKVRVLTIGPRDGTTPMAAQRWLSREFLRVPVDEREEFVLIAADLHTVSMYVHRLLSAFAQVGRVAFTHPDGARRPDLARYARYAAKVVDWAHRRPTDLRVSLFSANDGSRALDLARRRLVEPVAASMRGTLPASVVAVPAALDAAELRAMAEMQAPGVLVSVAHGMAPGGASVDRYAQQGDLRIGRSILSASAVGAGTFLPGGLWLSVACFGAGTPARSRFASWLTWAGEDEEDAQRVLGMLHPVPFIAQLPQAALANPEGPLAVVAHVDLAWSHAFATPTVARDPRAPSRRIVDAVANLTRTAAGVAPVVGGVVRTLQREVRRFDRLNAEVAGAPAARRAEAWLTRNDLDGYILLGDPAVTLPFSTS